VAAALSIAAWLLLAGQVQAATEGPAATSSGDTTLLIAGLAGAALAAVWLLKPSRPRRPRPPDEPTETTVAHARPVERDRTDT
jgi:membrane protein implicated in regulation of membrane protease activity